MIKKINKFFLFSTLSVFVQSNFAYSQQVEENRDNTTSNVNNSENESLSDDEIVEKQKATFNPETNTDLETNSTPTTTHSNTAAQKRPQMIVIVLHSIQKISFQKNM